MAVATVYPAHEFLAEKRGQAYRRNEAYEEAITWPEAYTLARAPVSIRAASSPGCSVLPRGCAAIEDTGKGQGEGVAEIENRDFSPKKWMKIHGKKKTPLRAGCPHAVVR